MSFFAFHRLGGKWENERERKIQIRYKKKVERITEDGIPKASDRCMKLIVTKITTITIAATPPPPPPATVVATNAKELNLMNICKNMNTLLLVDQGKMDNNKINVETRTYNNAEKRTVTQQKQTKLPNVIQQHAKSEMH